MPELSRYDVECKYTDYKVSLYPEMALVWVVKTNRNGKYLQQIKHRSKTFNAVLKALAAQAQPGSLTAEHLAQCADTQR